MECEIFGIFLKHVSDHLSMVFPLNNISLSQIIKPLQKSVSLKNSAPKQGECSASRPNTVPVDSNTPLPTHFSWRGFVAAWNLSGIWKIGSKGKNVKRWKTRTVTEIHKSTWNFDSLDVTKDNVEMREWGVVLNASIQEKYP